MQNARGYGHCRYVLHVTRGRIVTAAPFAQGPTYPLRRRPIYFAGFAGALPCAQDRSEVRLPVRRQCTDDPGSYNSALWRKPEDVESWPPDARTCPLDNNVAV